MAIVYVGGGTIGAFVPGALTLKLAGELGIGLALPDIQARLAALAAFSAQVTLPSFQADLQLAFQIVGSLQAALSIGITPPTLDLQLSLVLALIAELQAAVVSINAQLTLIAGIGGLLATAGVHAYALTAQVDQLGPQLDTELASGLPGGAPTDAANALVLVTSVGAAWAAMSSFFKVTP